MIQKQNQKFQTKIILLTVIFNIFVFFKIKKKKILAQSKLKIIINVSDNNMINNNKEPGELSSNDDNSIIEEDIFNDDKNSLDEYEDDCLILQECNQQFKQKDKKIKNYFSEQTTHKQDSFIIDSDKNDKDNLQHLHRTPYSIEDDRQIKKWA